MYVLHPGGIIIFRLDGAVREDRLWFGIVSFLTFQVAY